MGDRFDVFVSHSSVDKPWVLRLVEHLGRYGVSVWLDENEIRPGDLFVDALEHGLEQSRSVALVVSPESMASGWVKLEYSRAIALTMRKNQPLQLIPVLLRTAELPGFLADRHGVDFRDDSRYADSVCRLVWGITGTKPAEVLALDANALPALPSTQAARVRSAFAGPEPRLLVFDNCEDEALLDEWLPASGGCRVLVTCRRAAFSAHLVAHTVPLDILPRPESLTLLRSLMHGQASDDADEATLDAICAELGDLPLALHLAGSFLARYHTMVTPAAYLAQLRAPTLLDHPSLQGRGAESSPTGHVLHAGKTFALSWDRLDPAHTVDAMARDLLQRAACLAPGEPIPHALLLATLGVPESDLDATLAQADALRRLLDRARQPYRRPEP